MVNRKPVREETATVSKTVGVHRRVPASEGGSHQQRESSRQHRESQAVETVIWRTEVSSNLIKIQNSRKYKIQGRYYDLILYPPSVTPEILCPRGGIAVGAPINQTNENF